jgi:hypothetical protein
MASVDLAPGQFRFYPDARPGLQAGRHRVNLVHAVTISNAELLVTSPDTPAPLTSNVHVDVDAPRFRLGPAEVQAVYPPAEASGAYQATLPFAVLRRRTLPWERGPAPDPIPWFVLVVLSDAEMGTEAQVVTITANDWLARLQRPTQPQNEPIDVLRVPGSLVAGVFPYQEEVPLLTHVRETSLSDSALAAGDDDGFFAVVMSGRLPEPGVSSTAYLLSIEHQVASLPKRGAATVPVSTLDFPILLSWSFRSTPDGAGFGEICAGLDVAAFGEPLASGPSVDTEGRIPVRYEQRAGTPEPGLYRGPLVTDIHGRQPVNTGPMERTVPSRGPDGTIDVGLAAAFELGRLLAIADRRVLRALRWWRRNQFMTQRLRPIPFLDDKIPPILRDQLRGFLAFALPYEVALFDLPDGLGLPEHPLLPPDIGPFTDPVRTLSQGWALPADRLRSIVGPDFTLPADLPTGPIDVSGPMHSFEDIVALVDRDNFGGLRLDREHVLSELEMTAGEISLLTDDDLLRVTTAGFERAGQDVPPTHGPGRLP